MPLEPGFRLGRYEVRELLGAGGMGEVYGAHDAKLDRDVALKVLPAAFAQDASLVQRFEREARVVAALEHPNILSIHDFGTDGGHTWAAMELLRGRNLRQALAEGPIPPRKVIELAHQMAAALGAAHDAGIVHRDVKPENVFVQDSGQVKVLDFGLATPSRPTDPDGPTATYLTDPGTVLGTVGYMSPEQVRGGNVDHRSDIFSLGCVLYEMLTGRRAFARDTSAETMTAILREEPPALQVSSDFVSPGLERLVRHCLEKNPTERFHSASDLAFALSSVTTSSDGSTRILGDPAQGSKRRITGLVLAGIAVALLGGLVGRSTGPSPHPGQILRSPLSGLLQQVTFEPPGAGQPSISPDGNTVAFVRDGDIYVQRVGGENAINLSPNTPEPEWQPAFSPDGQRIAFRSERDGGGIFVMGATGESVQRVTDFGYNPAWSPDGKELVVATEAIVSPRDRQTTSQLWRLDVATGVKTLVSEGDAVQPDWSPNGERIVFWGLPPRTGRRVLQTVPAQGGDPTVLVDDGFMNWAPRWTVDGQAIVFNSDRKGVLNLWYLPVDEATGTITGDATPITLSEQPHGFASLARDGTIAFAVERSEHTVLRASFDLDTMIVGHVETVHRTSRPLSLSDISPSGDWLLFRIEDRHEDLMVMRSDGTDRIRLTDDAFRDRNASFGPNGDFVYFDSNRSGQYGTWRIRRDGSGLSPVSIGTNFAVPTVSPDGRSLAGFSVDRNNTAVVDLTRPLAERVAEWIPELSGRGMVYPEWSPDGTKLVGYGQTKTETGGILIFTLATGKVEIVRETGLSPRFLPDGRILFFEEGAYFVLDLATGAATSPNLEALGDKVTVLVSRGSRSLAAIRSTNRPDVWILRPEARPKPEP